MKKLTTIILAIIMTLLSTPQKTTDEPPVTAEKTPQTAITASVEQMPEDNETTTETAFVGEVSETRTEVNTEETTATESQVVTEEPKVFTEEKTPTEQETVAEECTEIAEETVVAESEEAVECIDEGDQSLVEYKPQIGGQLNPFENDTPTKIDDRSAEDYVGEGEDRPGEGKHF